ncbi:MAG: hypothetical protein Q9190_004812 [Brigantiaea leucoxantha]
MDKTTIGVLGGGQLARMLTEAAQKMDIKVVVLDAENAPAMQINKADHVIGSFKDRDAVFQLACRCDVLTMEIEHVNTDALEELSNGIKTVENWQRIKTFYTEIQPSWRTVRVIQDKYLQKKHLQERAIPVTEFIALEAHGSAVDLQRIGHQLGYPFMLKSRTEAYDGRGNYPVRSTSDISTALAALKNRPLYAEKWANFTAELAVMVVKTNDEADSDWEKVTLAYPVVETIHEDSICKLVYAPARNISEVFKQEAQKLARRAVAGFWGKGIFGVEMFAIGDEFIYLNEIAPRPHNSGHATIESCWMSQYEAHIRAILELPIPENSTNFKSPQTNAVMLNILGGAHPNRHNSLAEEASKIGNASVHLYGKGEARPGRKMGHITLLSDSMDEAQKQMEPLIRLAEVIREERSNLNLESTSKTVPKTPVVAVTMGSKSDCPTLQPGINLLRELEIPHTVSITSAHRTPELMTQFAKEAASKGIKVIIAAAAQANDDNRGGAAHLPGMLAANTFLPVIGVPVRGSVLDGQDSLLSIVQMPRGCPVATVGINNSINAAQLAARILATNDGHIRQRLQRHLTDQTDSVLEDGENMKRLGFEAFCSKDQS